MARTTYTEAQKQAALKLYETDGPTAVEKKLGIPKGTLSRWVKKAGVRTVRNERTREAVEAKVQDGKLRRQNIVHRLYAQSESILSDLEAEQFRTLLKGAYGKEEETLLRFVPPADRRTLLQALNTALTTAANTEKVDSDNGSEAAKSMLQALTDQLRGADAAGDVPKTD